MPLRTSVITAVFLLIVDRALKVVVSKGLLSGSFFGFGYPRLALHKNFGIVFDLPVPHLFVVGLSSILILALLVFCARALRRRRWEGPALIFKIGGAASNLYDRLTLGYVIDVIEIVPRSVWNLADALILIGIALLLLRQPKKP